jgi:hypothetical protein
MNRLFIDATKATPRVEFLPSGELSIHGRSLPEDSISFYNPIIQWIKQSNFEKVSLEIRLEYMNTSSYKQIYTLLNELKENINIKHVVVNWFFEEGDDDGYETGKEFESLIRLPFKFHEYAEVVY